jgi:hypothetical protein
MELLLGRLQSSGLATAIGESALATGLLSSIHLLGLTLIVGGALVSGLRLLGVMFARRPVPEVTLGIRRGIAIGLVISAVTGFLLMAPRATSAFRNEFFQTKMLLLAAAVVFHFSWCRAITARAGAKPVALRLTGALGLVLWFGVAVAGCAYILLE